MVTSFWFQDTTCNKQVWLLILGTNNRSLPNTKGRKVPHNHWRIYWTSGLHWQLGGVPSQALWTAHSPPRPRPEHVTTRGGYPTVRWRWKGGAQLGIHWHAQSMWTLLLPRPLGEILPKESPQFEEEGFVKHVQGSRNTKRRTEDTWAGGHNCQAKYTSNDPPQVGRHDEDRRRVGSKHCHNTPRG